MVMSFIIEFLKVWDIHAPLRSRCVRRRPTPWMNANCLRAAYTRDAKYRQYLKCRSEASLISYKKAYNDTKRLFRLTKREFFIRDFRAGAKSFSKNIKNCTGLGQIKFSNNSWRRHLLTNLKNSSSTLLPASYQAFHLRNHIPFCLRLRTTICFLSQRFQATTC